MRAPDVVGELEGWKGLILHESRWRAPRLLSPQQQFIWTPGNWTRARCQGGDHAGVPHEEHHCGIYAAADREQMIGHWDFYVRGRQAVLAELALAGKVIPGSRAHRAEKARIVRLYLPAVRWQLADALERAYRCEVVIDNILKSERSTV